MREMLVPIFGEWGAVVAQFLLTVVIVFGLIGAVWWFVRRYSGVHFSGIGRGRVPRLAILDVMPVDRRRRLVLVRRDNVEHLLLIGGPSDVVVEGAIQRVRQRAPQPGAAQQAQLAAARAAMQPAIAAPAPADPDIPQDDTALAGEAPDNAPIPFPVARAAQPQPAAATGRSLFRSLRQSPAPEAPAAPEPAAAPAAPAAARFVAPQEPAPQEPPAYEPAEDPASHAPGIPADEQLLSEVMTAEAMPPEPPGAEPSAAPPPATFAEAEWEAAEAARQSALDLGDMAVAEADIVEAPVTAAGPDETVSGAAGAEEPAPPESVAKVSDLEREMARLLDEITTRRSS